MELLIMTINALPEDSLRIGHRGHPGFPRTGENTIESFEEAMAHDANAIEYDLRRTKDGRIVCFHDDTMERITGMPGLISDYAYEELAALDAGYGRRIPLLEDVLKQIGKRAVHNIELKETGLAEEVLKLVVKYGLCGCVFVSAFDARHDRSVANGTATWDDLGVFPPCGIPIALLAGEARIARLGEQGFVAAALVRHASAVNPPLASATRSLVELAHEADLKVYVYTVNEPDDIARMISIGVDGIFSDFVERLSPQQPFLPIVSAIPEAV